MVSLDSAWTFTRWLCIWVEQRLALHWQVGESAASAAEVPQLAPSHDGVILSLRRIERAAHMDVRRL